MLSGLNSLWDTIHGMCGTSPTVSAEPKANHGTQSVVDNCAELISCTYSKYKGTALVDIFTDVDGTDFSLQAYQRQRQVLDYACLPAALK